MTVLNFAHRGASSLAPENTFPAIRKAWETGAHGIEVDVGVTRDGELVLLHDPLLGRTTNVEQIYPDRKDQPLATFSLEELQQLDAGSWFVDTDPFSQIRAGMVPLEEIRIIQNTPIPRLKDVLRYIKDKKWRVNLDLKSIAAPMDHFPLAEAVIRLIGKEGISLDKIIISSFDHTNLRIVSAINSDIEINALIGKKQEMSNNWGNYEFETYNANAAFINESQIRKARDRGCSVNLYTVNKPEDMQRFMNWGVKALITDYPQILAGLIDQHHPAAL